MACWNAEMFCLYLNRAKQRTSDPQGPYKRKGFHPTMANSVKEMEGITIIALNNSVNASLSSHPKPNPSSLLLENVCLGFVFH